MSRKVKHWDRIQTCEKFRLQPGLKLTRMSQTQISDRAAQRIYHRSGRFESQICLDEQSFEIIPGGLGDFRCTQDASQPSKSGFAGSRKSLFPT